MDAHRHSGKKTHPGIPIETRRVNRHHLIRREARPSFSPLAHVEFAILLQAHGCDHRCALDEHLAEVALNGRGEFAQPAEIDGSGAGCPRVWGEPRSYRERLLSPSQRPIGGKQHPRGRQQRGELRRISPKRHSARPVPVRIIPASSRGGSHEPSDCAGNSAPTSLMAKASSEAAGRSRDTCSPGEAGTTG